MSEAQKDDSIQCADRLLTFCCPAGGIITTNTDVSDIQLLMSLFHLARYVQYNARQNLMCWAYLRNTGDFQTSLSYSLAQHIFDNISQQSVVSWGDMIQIGQAFMCIMTTAWCGLTPIKGIMLLKRVID